MPNSKHSAVSDADYVRVSDLAESVGYSEAHIRRLIDKGRIPATKVGRAFLIDRLYLDPKTWLQEGEAAREDSSSVREALGQYLKEAQSILAPPPGESSNAFNDYVAMVLNCRHRMVAYVEANVSQADAAVFADWPPTPTDDAKFWIQAFASLRARLISLISSLPRN